MWHSKKKDIQNIMIWCVFLFNHHISILLIVYVMWYILFFFQPDWCAYTRSSILHAINSMILASHIIIKTWTHVYFFKSRSKLSYFTLVFMIVTAYSTYNLDVWYDCSILKAVWIYSVAITIKECAINCSATNIFEI